MPNCVCSHTEDEHDGPGTACSRCMCMYFEEEKNDGPKPDDSPGEVWQTKKEEE